MRSRRFPKDLPAALADSGLECLPPLLLVVRNGPSELQPLARHLLRPLVNASKANTDGFAILLTVSVMVLRVKAVLRVTAVNPTGIKKSESSFHVLSGLPVNL